MSNKNISFLLVFCTQIKRAVGCCWLPLFSSMGVTLNVIRVTSSNTVGSRSAKHTSSCEHFGELRSFFISPVMVYSSVKPVEFNS